MIELLLSCIFGAVASFLKDLINQSRHEQDLKKLGASQAAEATQRLIQEKADEQHANDMADRGSAADVASRLRDRLAGD